MSVSLQVWRLLKLLNKNTMIEVNLGIKGS